MGKIFGLTVMAIFFLLVILEIHRYQRARRAPDEFPYPRRRLSRRIAIALIFCAIIALVTFWPAVPRKFMPYLLPLVPIGLLIGLVLLWRDLRETSQAVVEQAQRLHEQAGAALRDILDQSPGGDRPLPPAAPPQKEHDS